MGEYANSRRKKILDLLKSLEYGYGHHGIPRNEEADKLERKGLMESLLTELS